jgi:hypothetical protein
MSRSSLANPSGPLDFETSWSKADKLFKKMSALSSDALASSLLREARKEKNMLRSLLKNYQVSEKMGAMLREGEVQREWLRLCGVR